MSNNNQSPGSAPVPPHYGSAPLYPPPHYAMQPQVQQPVYNQPRHSSAPRWDNNVPLSLRKRSPFFGIVLTFLIIGGLISGLNYLLISVVTPAGALLGTVLSTVILLILFGFYYFLDRGEPETRKMLILGFLWGALGATGTAVIFNELGSYLFGRDVGVTVIAPMAEESFKGLFLLFLFWWKRSHFDGVLDGLIYAGFIGMGFAFVENITYFADAYSGLGLVTADSKHGSGVLVFTFLLRGASAFLHPMATGMTGIAIGYGIYSKNRSLRIILPVIGWTGAVIVHSGWNTSSTLVSKGIIDIYFFLGIVGLYIAGFVAYIIFCFIVRSRAQKNLRVILQTMIGKQVIGEREAFWVETSARRKHTVGFAKLKAGPTGEKNMKEYHRYAMLLCNLYNKILLGVASPDAAEIMDHYFYRLTEFRSKIDFPPIPGNLIINNNNGVTHGY